MWNVSSHLSGLDIAVLLRAGSDAGAGVYGYGPFSGLVAGTGGPGYGCRTSAGSALGSAPGVGARSSMVCLLFFFPYSNVHGVEDGLVSGKTILCASSPVSSGFP